MSAAVLTWVARGTMGTVLCCTLWLANRLDAPPAPEPVVIAIAAEARLAASAPQR